MDWINGLQRAIDYLEEHLLDPIDYQALAAQSYASSYHFQRVFSILCGMTVGEYVRCRRLSLAGAELAAGRMKVLDAALKYGYESPDSFAKAFQRFHGVLPSQAGGAKLRSFSRLVLKINLEGGQTMDYRIEHKPAMALTGYKRRFTGIPGERETQEEEMYVTTRPLQYILQALAEEPTLNYDVITNINDEGYDFYIARAIDPFYRDKLHQPQVLGEEFARYYENLTIPAQTYAVFETERCAYPTEIFMELRRRIVSEWLPGSGYQLAAGPEIVATHWLMGDMKEERYRELWMPVEKLDGK